MAASLLDSRRATGLEYLVGNDKHSARARLEVIVASGAFEFAATATAFGIRTGAAAPVARNCCHRRCSGRRRRSRRRLCGGPHHFALQESDYVDDAVYWGEGFAAGLRYAFTRRGIIYRSWRSPRDVSARASCIRDARLAMLDCAVLRRHHRRRIASVPGRDRRVHVAAAETGACGDQIRQSARSAGNPPELSGDTQGLRDHRGGRAQDERWIFRRLPWRAISSRRFEPGKQCDTDDDFVDSIRCCGSTTYHPVGSCRMGQDRNARRWGAGLRAVSRLCAWSMPRSCRP